MSVIWVTCLLVLGAPPQAAAPPTERIEKTRTADQAAIRVRDSKPAERDDNKTKDAAPQQGLWPSPKLMDALLARWANDIGDQYDLNDEQRATVRKEIVQDWGRYLNENRATIQPLVNELLELRLGVEPPSEHEVQAWAEKTMPAFQQFREQITQSADQLRGVLEPAQRAKFELDALKLSAGLKLAEMKLSGWQEGTVKPDELWVPTRAERKRRREAARKKRDQQAAVQQPSAQEPTAEQAEPDQIDLELAAWAKYVADFVSLYELDEGQRNAARSLLEELTERANTHRDRRREEIAALEKRIANNKGTEKEIAEIRKQLVELYGPIDEMFKELKERLSAIPTAAQRAKVVGSDGDAEDKRQTAPKRHQKPSKQNESAPQ